MGYRVEYRQEREEGCTQGTGIQMTVLLSVCVLLFVVAVRVFWEEGYDVLQELLCPGNRDSASEEALTHQLGEGGALKEVFAAFGRQLVGGGDVY